MEKIQIQCGRDINDLFFGSFQLLKTNTQNILISPVGLEKYGSILSDPSVSQVPVVLSTREVLAEVYLCGHPHTTLARQVICPGGRIRCVRQSDHGVLVLKPDLMGLELILSRSTGSQNMK